MKTKSLIAICLIAIALGLGGCAASSNSVAYLPLVPPTALRGFQGSAITPGADSLREWIQADPIMDIRGCQVSALYAKINPVDGHRWLVNDPSDSIPVN